METAQRISTTLKPIVNTVCRIANGVLDALASPATAQGMTRGLMQSIPNGFIPRGPPPPYRAPVQPRGPPQRGTLVGGKKRLSKNVATQKRRRRS